MLALTLVIFLVSPSLGLDNGLARTPPMGWISWLAFGCQVDCDKEPNNCLNEAQIMRTADRLVSDGYRDVGYEYVIIDDCWLEQNRTEDGKMVPDRKRFKSGMKALADYIHSKNLKFGMYQDIGTKTCAGYPGLKGYEKIDVQTFVEWEIDYIKVDGCYEDVKDMDKDYPAFGKLLNDTGRPIVYSCSWPAYQEDANMTVDYKSVAKHCNLWRNFNDVESNWKSVLNIMDWFGERPHLAKVGGPGHFNDADMLVAGNPGVSPNVAYSQMYVWSMLAAPLLISADLDKVTPETKEILLYKELIKLNQWYTGLPGERIHHEEDYDVWGRVIDKVYYMVAVIRSPAELTKEITFTQMKLPENTYYVQKISSTASKEDNLLDSQIVLEPGQSFTISLEPYGSALYSFTPKKSNVQHRLNTYVNSKV